MKFEVYRNGKKEYRWRLRAPNGRLIANAGESYRRKIDCMTAIERVKGTAWDCVVVFL